jgi:hypothetical protein
LLFACGANSIAIWAYEIAVMFPPRLGLIILMTLRQVWSANSTTCERDSNSRIKRDPAERRAFQRPNLCSSTARRLARVPDTLSIT